MAREYAQIKLAIWADDDWRDLSPLARYLYLTLLTSPSLSHCGVADWRPARIGALNGMETEDVLRCGAELVEALYLVIDEESEEVLIRSFIRNDGLMKQPRMAVSMANAHSAVASKAIRGVIVHELRRLREDHPELTGWTKDKALGLLDLGSVSASTYPLGKGPFGGSFRGGFTPGLGETLPNVSGSPTPSPAPTPTPSNLHRAEIAQTTQPDESGDTDRFDEFWDVYGKKVDRKGAEKKWALALRKPDVTADRLIAAARSYVTYEREHNQGGRYVMDPTRWLHGERWRDERLERPASAPPQSRVQQHLALAKQFADEQAPIPFPQIGGSR